MFLALPLSTTFLLYTVAIVSVVATTIASWLGRQTAWVALGALLAWVAYATLLGATGVVANPHLFVPGIFILLAPIITVVAIVLVRSEVGMRIAVQIPLGVLIGLQAFRVGVELTIHKLWEHGTLPKLMTLDGGNIDILIGFSAPLVALLVSRGLAGRRVAFVWNLIGIASLLNVALRSVLSAPGPLNLLHGEVLNTALGTFPFTFIPGFMAPLAMMLHVLTFRALRAAGHGRYEHAGAAASAPSSPS